MPYTPDRSPNSQPYPFPGIPLPLTRTLTLSPALPLPLYPKEAAAEKAAAGGASQPRRRDAAALQRAWTLDSADLHAAEPLGHGSQSDVLHGKWQGLRVAIKQPRVSGVAGSEFVRREVRALSRVQHPNVVRLYGVCFEPQPRVVMAFAAGGSLADQLATRQSSLLEVRGRLTLTLARL